jgi:hypothetical protein
VLGADRSCAASRRASSNMDYSSVHPPFPSVVPRRRPHPHYIETNGGSNLAAVADISRSRLGPLATSARRFRRFKRAALAIPSTPWGPRPCSLSNVLPMFSGSHGRARAQRRPEALSVAPAGDIRTGRSGACGLECETFSRHSPFVRGKVCGKDRRQCVNWLVTVRDGPSPPPRHSRPVVTPWRSSSAGPRQRPPLRPELPPSNRSGPSEERAIVRQFHYGLLDLPVRRWTVPRAVIDGFYGSIRNGPRLGMGGRRWLRAMLGAQFLV